MVDAYPKDASYFKWLKDVGSDADSIRDEAGRRGSIVHELTEQYDMGEEINLVSEYGSPRYKILEWAMLGRYVEFRYALSQVRARTPTACPLLRGNGVRGRHFGRLPAGCSVCSVVSSWALCLPLHVVHQCLATLPLTLLLAMQESLWT